jgi:hypothetical protein
MVIDKPDLKEYCWHPCVLKHVQILPLFDPTVWDRKRVAKLFLDAFGEATRRVRCLEDEDFEARRGADVRMSVGIAVDGKEYLAVLTVREVDTSSESNILVGHSSTGYPEFALLLDTATKLKYDAERDVFLPKSVGDRTGVTPAVSRVKNYVH